MADQSSAAKLTYASKFRKSKNYKGKLIGLRRKVTYGSQQNVSKLLLILIYRHYIEVLNLYFFTCFDLEFGVMLLSVKFKFIVNATT